MKYSAKRWFEEGPVKEFLKADAPALQALLPYAGEFCREYDRLVLYAAAKGESVQLERLLRMEGGLTKARVKKALAAADDAGQDGTVDVLMGLLAEAPAKYVPAPLPEGQVDMPAKEAKELFATESCGPASVAILRYRADAPDVVVPARINGKRVAAICEGAFSPYQEHLKYERIGPREKIKSVVFPEGLAFIGRGAFRGCCDLECVALSEGLVEIGVLAFKYCSSLNSVSFPSSLMVLGAAAFESCQSLTSVSFLEGTKSIGNSAFSDCCSLEQVELPLSLKSIGDQAFRGCWSLREIVIPDKVSSVGDGAFWGCSSLRSVTLPRGLRTIKDDAFYDCSALASVTFPKSLRAIRKSAFERCKSLKPPKLPSGCTAVGSNAFLGCELDARGLYSNVLPTLSRDSQVDDIVAFGSARWRILALDSGRALLHACDVVCERQYHKRRKGVTWGACDLRAWLNSEYFERSFEEYERSLIATTTLSNPKNVAYGARGGNDTQDRVFLLSIDEARAYKVSLEDDTFVSDKHWLRSPGCSRLYAAYVAHEGVDTYGHRVDVRCGVRPAIWVNL